MGGRQFRIPKNIVPFGMVPDDVNHSNGSENTRFRNQAVPKTLDYCYRWQLSVATLMLAGFLGCTGQPLNDDNSPSNGNSRSGSASRFDSQGDSIDASTLLQQVSNTYALAKSYRDKGALYLSYTLEGRAIVEPHPFSTIWDSQDHLSSRIFKGHLQSDSKLLTCYVFDIATSNLDEQQLFLSVENQLPLKQLYDDSIVRHYLGGYADLPLDETDKSQSPVLIPPPISLLTQQFSFGWVQAPQAAQRLEDAHLDQRPCYVIRSQFNDMTADLWIDQETKLVAQVSMPLKIMDRQVLTSGEIRDVSLVLKFHEASVNGADSNPNPSTDELFSVALKPKATPVRRFVSIPDPFPSTRIGQQAPKFELLLPDGKTVNHLFFDGKTSVLLWLENAELESLSGKLRQVIDPSSQSDLRFGLVYSDSNLNDAASDSAVPRPELERLARSVQAPLYYDRQLQLADKFSFKAMPAALIIGPQSRVEYVKILTNENWEQDLLNAIARVRRGEDVAKAMKDEYQKFVHDYHLQRAAVSAAQLIGVSDSVVSSESEEVGISGVGKVVQTPQTDRPSQWKSKKGWTNSNLQRPGNILFSAHRQPATLYLLDGWRTVVALDMQGTETARHELDLPEQGAVCCLRMASKFHGEDSPLFAAFNVHAEKVYLFDHRWKLQTALPPNDFKHDGIRDVQFLENENGFPAIVITFANGGGCYSFDLEQRTMTRISTSRVDSLATSGHSIFAAHATGFGQLSEDSVPEMATSNLMFQRITGIVPAGSTPAGNVLTGNANRDSQVVVTAVDRENNWYLAGATSDGEIAWRQPIGSQLFENEIEPLSVCSFRPYPSSSAGSVIGVADANQRVTVIADNGSYLGQFASPVPLNGIGLYEYQGTLNLVLSTDQGVSQFELSPVTPNAIPASHPLNP